MKTINIIMNKNIFKLLLKYADLLPVEQDNDDQSAVSEKGIKRLQDTAEKILSLIEELKNASQSEVWRIDINDRLKQITTDLYINMKQIQDFLGESKSI